MSEILDGSLTAATDEFDQISEACESTNQSQSNRDHNWDVQACQYGDLLFLPTVSGYTWLLYRNMSGRNLLRTIFCAFRGSQNAVNLVRVIYFTLLV